VYRHRLALNSVALHVTSIPIPVDVAKIFAAGVHTIGVARILSGGALFFPEKVDLL